MPEWHCHKLQLGAMRDERETADPGRIELTRRQQRGDLLVRAPVDEGNRRTGGALEVRLQPPLELQIRGQEHRCEAEPDRHDTGILCRIAEGGRNQGGRRAKEGASMQSFVSTRGHSYPRFFISFEEATAI